MKKIEEVCERAQYALWNRFWDNEKEVFVNHYPVKEEESWIYWWHAHALDALLDGFVRTKETYYPVSYTHLDVYKRQGGASEMLDGQ